MREKTINDFNSKIPNEVEFLARIKDIISNKNEVDVVNLVTDTPYSTNLLDTNSKELFINAYTKYDLTRFSFESIRKPISFTQICYAFNSPQERVEAIELFENFNY